MFQIGPYPIKSPFLLAPMAGVSEMPFRVIALEMGAGLATTELISAKGIFYRNQRTQQYLTYDKEKEQPYSLQLFGGDLEAMKSAAVEAVKAGAQIIDINMGCPVKKVTKTGAGSALMCEPVRAADLVRGMREATENAVPITVKIRSGWDDSTINCVEMAKTMEDAGAAAIALHARTRAQGYSGKANWEHIKAIKDALRIPVIGNGDVVTVADAYRMLSETGCDAVMIGRGALGNPWIFTALQKKLPDYKPTRQERLTLMLRHLEEHIAFHSILPAPNSELRAMRSFRTHLVWYSRGIKGASSFREAVMQIDDKNQLLDTIVSFFDKSVIAESEETVDDGIDFRQAFG